MNQRQAIAIANPCYLADDTTNSRYRYSDGQGWVVLTLNSGFE